MARSQSFTLSVISLLILALPTFPFSCDIDLNGIKYDLSPLGGTRTASKNMDTPPTTSEARVRINLCDKLGTEDGLSEEDQCSEHTKVCLKMLNHKKSAAEEERITAVIPLWTTNTPDEHIYSKAQGENGKNGIRLYVQGPEYAGRTQHLNLSLICETEDHNKEPRLVSYSPERLSLEWATPHACPKSAGRQDGPPGSDGGGSRTGSGEGGIGLWKLITSLFWLLLIGLGIYFGLGILYNHQQYSAKGWDLLPHRDFWREFPALLSDLFSHLFANVRGGGGGSRGGYSSLG